MAAAASASGASSLARSPPLTPAAYTYDAPGDFLMRRLARKRVVVHPHTHAHAQHTPRAADRCASAAANSSGGTTARCKLSRRRSSDSLPSLVAADASGGAASPPECHTALTAHPPQRPELADHIDPNHADTQLQCARAAADGDGGDAIDRVFATLTWRDARAFGVGGSRADGASASSARRNVRATALAMVMGARVPQPTALAPLPGLCVPAFLTSQSGALVPRRVMSTAALVWPHASRPVPCSLVPSASHCAHLSGDLRQPPAGSSVPRNNNAAAPVSDATAAQVPKRADPLEDPEFVVYHDMTLAEILREKPLREVLWITEAATIFRAIEMMNANRVGALIVKDADGRVSGIITERDYLQKVALRGLSSREAPVRQIMTTDVKFGRADQTCRETLKLMTDNRFRHLPVVNDSHELIGLISIGDLVKTIVADLAETALSYRDYIAGNYRYSASQASASDQEKRKDALDSAGVKT